MKRLIAILALLLLILWVVSCSPQKSAQRKIKRAERLINKAKALDNSVSLADTIIIKDTIYIEAIKIDTLIKDVGDTITIENKQMVIRYFRDTVTNFVKIDGECKADTIYMTRKIPSEKIIIRETFWETMGIKSRWQKILFWGALILIIILLLLAYIFRSYSRL